MSTQRSTRSKSESAEQYESVFNSDAPIEERLEAGLELIRSRLYLNTLKAYESAGKVVALAESSGHVQVQSAALNYMGTCCGIVGDFSKALDHFQEALELVEEAGLQDRVGVIKGNIGGVYYHLEDHSKAIAFYEESLMIARALDDKTQIGNQVGNLASAYREIGNYSKAISLNLESVEHHRKSGNTRGMVLKTCTTGSAYQSAGQYQKAIEYLNKAIELSRGYDVRTEAFSLSQLGKLYMTDDFEGRDLKRSEKYLLKSLQLTEDAGQQKQLFEIHQTLSELYVKLNKHPKALDHFREYHRIEKTVYTEDARQMALHVEHRLAIQEAEKINALQLAKNRELAAAFDRVEEERLRSERLLLNILPSDIAEELKEHGASKARRHENVTVLFADFKGFSKTSANMKAEELVGKLHTCFTEFDHIMSRHRIEKIKTIGDAYMAVSGLQDGSLEGPNHAKRALHAALDMQLYMQQQHGTIPFQMRLGLHSGSVVAGVVGAHKFQYDIWGNTVNMASRMESSGAVGEVNLSATTHGLLEKDPEFDFEFRGQIETKHEGAIPMYFGRFA